GRAGLAVLVVLHRKPALHVEARASARPPLDRLGEEPVDLAGIGFGPGSARSLRGEEGAVEPIRLRPGLAGDEAVRPAQKLEVVVVERVGLALNVELRQRQRPALDPGGVEPCKRLEIAFVGDPDAAEIGVVLGPFGVFKDGRQGSAREAPPLAAEMRHKALRDRAAEPDAALRAYVEVEKPALLA